MMYEIIIAILMIICYVVASIIIYQMRKTIRSYQEENMHLRRRLDESENKPLDFKIAYQTDNYNFEKYHSAIKLPLDDFITVFDRKIDRAMKENLAWDIAKKLITDNKISFTADVDMLEYNAIITATLKVVNNN